MDVDPAQVLSLAQTRLRHVLSRLMTDGTVQGSSDASASELFPIAISADEGEALRDWVVREKATRTIEIGLGYGVSALFTLEGLLANSEADGRHVVIDPFQESGFANHGLKLIEEAGVSHMVEHHPERSQIVLPSLIAAGEIFDLAFVDGNHRFDAVFVDLFNLGSLVRGGGVIIMDDYQLPGIAKAASFFVTNVGWAIEEVSDADPFHQWAVLRTPRASDSRPFDFFLDF